MNFGEYQKLAMRTAGAMSDKDDKDKAYMIGGLGIAGEAGEVADYLKKVFGHGHPLDKIKLKKELGDVLWYSAYLATLADMTLEEVAEANIDKLKERYPDGFKTELSMNRKSGDV